MYVHETYQVNDAIMGYQNGLSHRPAKWRSKGKFDCIIRRICMGCERTLGRYEINHALAFCFNCRIFLFPETIAQNESNANHVYSREHSRWSGR